MANEKDIDQAILDKLKPYEKWRDAFKDKWKYKQKQVVFEDEEGKEVTPSTTTTTKATTTKITPKPTSPPKNITATYPTVIITDTTTLSGGRTEEVAGAETTQLIKIVGITCASLIGFILVALLIIRLCRRSSAKRNQRLTVRRPLTENEREDHIYAEIEPLQRAPSPGGASGTSSDVQLPKRKGKRRAGVSSFRSISTRIYRFFNVETDNQSVFYNKSTHQVENPAPEPPERNITNGRRSNKPVKRGESTASRRPLLDGESQVSTSSAEMRSNIYNPLIRENEVRASGPYDHLTLSKTPSGQVIDDAPEPSSPHDYFTLVKASNEENTDNPDAIDDSVVVENEIGGGIETIEEEVEPSETPKNHEYFVLEPHEREDCNGSPSKSSVKSNQSLSKASSSRSGSPVKGDKSKPEVTPRVTKMSDKQSPSSPSSIGEKDNDSKIDEVKRSESKEETYVLAKLGDAPEPPDAVNDDEYLSPSEMGNKPDYVDVFPNPPPRSSSLQPHELIGNSSPSLNKKPPADVLSRSQNNSPTRKNGSATPKSSPSKSPTKSSLTKSSPTRKTVSPTHSKTETTL